MNVTVDRGRVLSLASNLIRSPSVNPPAELNEIASLVKEWLNEAGISAELYEPVKGKVSLLAKIGSGERRVLLNGHLDVVPIGDRSRWRFDPFSGEVVAGKLLGRGATDMKGGCAALVETVVALTKVEARLNGEVLLSLVSDEETGGQYGTKFLAERGLLRSDVAVIAEPTGLDVCVIGEKGVLWCTLTSIGKPGHGSMAGYVGDNAIERLTSSIPSIKRLHERKFKSPPELREALRESGRLIAKISKNPRAREVPERITVNIGVIKGGTKCNMVPDRAEMEIDMRIPLGVDPRDVRSELSRLLSKRGIKIKVLNESKPNYTSPRDHSVGAFLTVASRVARRRVRPAIIWAATDGRYLREMGIPTIMYGPGDWSGIHAYNEYVSVKSIYTCADIYLEFVRRYLL